MKTLFENDYVKMLLDEENSVLVDIWSSETEKLTYEDFKKLLLKFKELIFTHQLHYALTDTLQFRLLMIPELQTWTLENITIPLCEGTPYNKHAFLMPLEFVPNVSVEQFTEETTVTKVKMAYFSNQEEAYQWLLAKEKD